MAFFTDAVAAILKNSSDYFDSHEVYKSQQIEPLEKYL